MSVSPPIYEAIGTKLRRRRLHHGFTLDELAAKSGVSKPYLSLIENNRLPNPPSDAKLRSLEETLEFKSGELVMQAQLQRAPKDVKVMLGRLARGNASIDLDDAYLTGMLHQLVEQQGMANVETLRMRSIPIINKIAAGYPTDFTDLSYPKGVADEYIGSPDVSDPDAFAARVFGDSMMPKYRPGDIVIFSPAADPRAGDDCFVRFTDGQTTFKQVFFEPNDEGGDVIRLHPRNEKYEVRVVSSEEVSGLFRALFKYERVDD